MGAGGLAVMIQHRAEHPQRRARRGRRGSRGGDGGSFGMNLVVPGQLGGRAPAGHRVGALGGDGEHAGDVGVTVTGVPEGPAGPAPLPGPRVGAGVQGAAYDQPAGGDGLGGRALGDSG